MGTVAFPVLKWQIRRLIAAAERAPYGRGPETLVDSSVRDCWQLGAEHITLGGARWPKTLRALTKRVAKGLGIPAKRIRLELYKLLIYEKGGFFSEHRDTEKTQGMVGTLVVALPTVGEGGELVVGHQEREEVVDLSATDPGELVFAAFYADCAHRTEPVRRGHRVSLVYNVAVSPGKGTIAQLAPDVSSETAEVASVLSKWASGDPEPKKIVWILDHLYSEASLGFEGLKGRDGVVCRVLANAARTAGCSCHLAILVIHEEGTPIDYYGGYGEYDEDEEVDEPIEFEEIYDSTQELTTFVRPSGRPPSLSDGLALNDGETLPAGALDNARPDEQRIMEATGNSGATAERAFRVAACVLWPRAWHALVIGDGPLDDLIGHTGRLLSADRESGLELVAGVVDRWLKVEARAWDFSRRMKISDKTLPATLELLVRAEDDAQSARFLEGVMVSGLTKDRTSNIIDLMEHVSANRLDPFLSALVTKQLGSAPDRVFRLFARASERTGVRDREAWMEVLRKHAAQAFRSLPASWKKEQTVSYSRWPKKPAKQVPSAVCDAIVAGQGLGLQDEGEQAARFILTERTRSRPATGLPRRLREVWTLAPELMSTSALARLWRKSADLLLERSSAPPGQQVPRTFPGPRCRCVHCRKLASFCRDAAAPVLRFSMRKDLRLHVEFEIRSARLPIQCTTEKSGIPHTLVCTKDSADYIRRVNRYQGDVAAMKILLSVAPTAKISWVAPVGDRLRLAIEAAAP